VPLLGRNDRRCLHFKLLFSSEIVRASSFES
jgi:hypothetical protein